MGEILYFEMKNHAGNRSRHGAVSISNSLPRALLTVNG